MAKGRGSKSIYQGAKLKEFRHKVSQLKAKGLTSKRTDARSQLPTRYYRAKVKALAPVLEGRAAAVKIAPKFQRQYREAGFPVFRGRVIVRKAPDEIARARKGLPQLERIIVNTPGRRVTQARIPLPARIQSIDDLIADILADPEKWDQKKGDYPPWLFAFTIGNGRSSAVFVEAESLAAHLNNYRKFEDEAWFDFETDFELFRIIEDSLPWNDTEGRKARRKSRSLDAKGRVARVRKRQRGGFQAIADADRKRAYRTGLKGAKRQAYLAKEKARFARNDNSASKKAARKTRQRLYSAAYRQGEN